MSRNMRRRRPNLMAISVGWLFADLLLAVAMLFLIANTIAPARPVVAKPTPTPVPTPTPTPTPAINALILDNNRITLKLENIDPDKVSAGDQGALDDLEQKIRDQVTAQGLQDRRAGIAIAYGGTDDPSDFQTGRASSVAAQVYNVLDTLGNQQKFVFCQTVHYKPLFSREDKSTTVVIDAYLFNQSVGNCSKIT